MLESIVESFICAGLCITEAQPGAEGLNSGEELRPCKEAGWRRKLEAGFIRLRMIILSAAKDLQAGLIGVFRLRIAAARGYEISCRHNGGAG
jgi:hypothetical protein